MMRRLLFVMVLAAAAGPALATGYFVNNSPTGCSGSACSDSNNCTALSTACLTIGGARGKASTAGDTVTIKAGTYFEDIDPTFSGNSSGGGTYITFQAATGEAVTVIGSQSIASDWVQDSTFTNLWKKSFATKPAGLVEEYAAPRFNQIANGGSWYQSRVGYVDVRDNPICGGAGSGASSTCDLNQLNTLCASKVVNGTWCYIGSTGTVYIRPGAYGVNPGSQGNDPPAANVVEVPTSNTWRQNVHTLTMTQDWVKYIRITFKDMPIQLCGADHVRFEDCMFLNNFISQDAACVNSTSLEVVGVTAPSVAQDIWKGNSYIENNWSEGDGFGLDGGGKCLTGGAYCSCSISSGTCAADSECGGGPCVSRWGVPDLLFDNFVLKNTRNFGNIGGSPGAVIQNSVLGPGGNHGIILRNDGNGLGTFTVKNTAFFHAQDQFYLGEECGTGSGTCTDRRRLNIDHITVMGPELTRRKGSNSGGITNQNNGPSKWDITVNNSLFWRSGGVGACDTNDPTEFTIDGDYNYFYGTGGGGSTSTGTGLAGNACKLDANTGLHDTVVPITSDTDPVFLTVFEDTTEGDGDVRSPHLAAGSPALDHGGSCKGTGCTNLTVDYEGTTRPQGAAKDPGADELGASGGQSCGNSIIESPEVCDNTALGSGTCAGNGFPSGCTLVCCDNTGDPANCVSGLHNCTTYGCSAGCTSAAQCNDGLDNDSDGFTDMADIGCSDIGDTTEAALAGTSWSIPQTDAGFTQAVHDANVAGGGITIKFTGPGTTFQIDARNDGQCTASGQPWACCTGSGTGTCPDSKGTCQGGSNNLAVCSFASDCPSGNCRIREFFTTNNTVDGESKGVVIEPTTLSGWIGSATRCGVGGGQACDSDGDGDPDNILDINDQVPRFFFMRASGNTMQGLFISKWADGVRFNTGATGRADNSVLRDFHCEYPGDNCASGDDLSGGETYADMPRGIQVINSVCKYASDKCHQIYGRDSGWSNSSDYDWLLQSVECVDSVGCLRANGNGYFSVPNLKTTMTGAGPSPIFNTCNYGIRSDGSGTGGLFSLSNASLAGCTTGIIADTDTQVIASGGAIGGTSVGIRVDGTAKVSVAGVTFNAPTGVDIASSHTGSVDLGNTDTTDGTASAITFGVFGAVSSIGGNHFEGCALGVANGRGAAGGYTAENACWDDSDPANEVTGTVDYTPLNPSCVVSNPTPTITIGCRGCTP